MRKAMGVAAIAVVLTIPGAAKATEVYSVVDEGYSSWGVQAHQILLAMPLAPTTVNVLVEPAGPGEVRITERSSLLFLGVRGVVPSITCRYATLLRSAICPGADGGGFGGSEQADRVDIRGSRAVTGGGSGGDDVITVQASGAGPPPGTVGSDTYIEISGGAGNDTIALERGIVLPGSGNDLVTTPGGGRVAVHGVTRWDRVDVRDGEDGDVVSCDQFPAAGVVHDPGDALEGAC